LPNSTASIIPAIYSIHYPRNLSLSEEERKPSRERVNASEHRMGSGEDWVAFLEKSGVAQAVMGGNAKKFFSLQ
jgi:hypothetical protein